VQRYEDDGSEQHRWKLLEGAEVEELEIYGVRMHFRRVSGEGPDEGWLTMYNSSGSPLLELLPEDHFDEAVVSDDGEDPQAELSDQVSAAAEPDSGKDIAGDETLQCSTVWRRA